MCTIQVDEKLAELTAEADLKAHQASWSEFKDTEAAIWSDRLLQLVQRAREERDSVSVWPSACMTPL